MGVKVKGNVVDNVVITLHGEQMLTRFSVVVTS